MQTCICIYHSIHPIHTCSCTLIHRSTCMYIHLISAYTHSRSPYIHPSIRYINQPRTLYTYIHTNTHTQCIWIFQTRTVPPGTFQNLQFKNSLWKQGITWFYHFLESCQEQVVSLLPEFSHLPQHSKISNLQIEPPEKMQNIRPNKNTYTA